MANAPINARKTPIAAYLSVAALSALVGFGAVYVTMPGADNAARDVAAAPAIAGDARAAEPAVTALPSGPGSNALSKGEMAAFVFKKAPEAAPGISFLDASGQTRALADWKGKVVLLNLWATWCAPCRKEMPALDRLQKEFGGDAFEVVALAVDTRGLDGAKKFLDEIAVQNLKLYADPSARAGTALKAIGMPTTLLIDAEGREIGRLVGPAEWDGEDAKRLVRAAIKEAS